MKQYKQILLDMIPILMQIKEILELEVLAEEERIDLALDRLNSTAKLINSIVKQ